MIRAVRYKLQAKYGFGISEQNSAQDSKGKFNKIALLLFGNTYTFLHM